MCECLTLIFGLFEFLVVDSIISFSKRYLCRRNFGNKLFGKA